jgi:hypothetical protein
MKQIKLSGREKSVLRYVDWATGSNGQEFLDATRLEPDDLVAVLNGLMDVGYMEMDPYGEHTDEATFREVLFEVNPSYAMQLKEAMSML